MVKNELKAVMALNGDTQGMLADAIGITRMALSNKINGKSVFTQPEIEKTALRYKLSAEDIQRIFFASTVN